MKASFKRWHTEYVCILKASDVLLNDFTEHWEAVEQERGKKIDSGFRTEETFFLCSLMPSVWQWLSFVGNDVVLCSYSYMTMEEKKYFSSLMMDCMNCAASGRVSTFHLNNMLANTLMDHILSHSSSVSPLYKHLQRITGRTSAVF